MRTHSGMAAMVYGVMLAWCLIGGAYADGEARPTASFGIDVWRNEDGLPQNSVIAMTEGRDGYLWLGTLNGLVRFDGSQFTVYDESNTPGLESSQIVHLYEDGSSNLWVGTESSGVFLVPETGTIRHFDIGGSSRAGRLRSVFEDDAGVVWLYTADGELCRYFQGKVDVYRLGPDHFSLFRAIIPGESGRVLVGTDRWLYTLGTRTNGIPGGPFKENEFSFRKLDGLLPSRAGGYWQLGDGRIQRWRGGVAVGEPSPYAWSNMAVSVSAVCEDEAGHLVVGTLGAGLFWYDGQGGVTSLSTNEGLSNNYVLSLVMDREGSLWVGTDGGGLNRVRRHVFGVLDPTRGMVVRSVSEDDQGGVWIGYHGGGVDHWQDGKWERFGTDQAWRGLAVRAVMVDRKGRIWAGTTGDRGSGLFQRIQGRFERVAAAPVLNRDVTVLYESGSGALWVGTRMGLVVWDGNDWKLFSAQSGLAAEDVRAIAEDREGTLWIGTRGGGLNWYRDGQFRSLGKKDGFPSDNVTSIYADGDGVLWIGTEGAGMIRYERGQWTRFSKPEGLGSNSTGYIVEDQGGYLWIGSNNGVMRILKSSLNDHARGKEVSLSVRIYGKTDGLPSAECTTGSQPGACRSRDGTLWLPTIEGLAQVHPARLRRNTNAPPVVIESVLVEGQGQGREGLRAAPLASIIIPAGKERLEIRYTSLNLAAPEQARFRYRMEGHETAWTDAGNVRVARYSRLPPGPYRFRVTACNEDGIWNETGGMLALVVLPPYWRTWWFLTISSVAGLGAVVAVVRYFSVQKLQRQLAMLKHQEALETERARIARDVHDQLGASLTQVALLGEMLEEDKDRPEDVQAHARQICQTARETTRSLDEIVWTVNPANDTLDGLVNYICKYAQDYLSVAGLRCRMELPSQLPAAPIPPEVRHNVFLAAKETITNVVRHANATGVWIRLQLEPGRFILEIADDGRGVAGMDGERAATRHGLSNMRKRLNEIGGSLAMDTAPEGGLRVRLSVPYCAP